MAILIYISCLHIGGLQELQSITHRLPKIYTIIKIHSPTAISSFVKESIFSAVTASPRLTADDLAAGRGLQFIPGAVDNAATSKDKIRGI